MTSRHPSRVWSLAFAPTVTLGAFALGSAASAGSSDSAAREARAAGYPGAAAGTSARFAYIISAMP